MTASGEHNQFRDEAAAWFAKMRGPDSKTHRPAFDAWLASGALHRQAYNSIAETWSIGKGLKRNDARSGPTTPKSGPRPSRRFGIIIAACAVPVGVAAGVGVMSYWRHAHESEADIAVNLTGVLVGAEQATSNRLPDRTTVTLAPGSRLAFDYRGATRELNLMSGSARFAVTHEARALVVHAGGGVVVDYGTIFDVAMDRGKVRVHLIEGSIAVRMPSVSEGREDETRMTQGQTIAYAVETAEPLPPVVSQNPAAPDATQVFDNETLANVLKLANGSPGPQILTADLTISALRVSGSLRIADHRHLARILADKLGLNVSEVGDTITLSRP